MTKTRTTTQVRCALYTRTSTPQGRDAQRKAAETLIDSQAIEGWTCLPERYDDGNADRPALQHLVADIEAGHVDVVVCSAADRLTRSPLDFARLMQTFHNHGVGFISVAEQGDTATSTSSLNLSHNGDQR